MKNRFRILLMTAFLFTVCCLYAQKADSFQDNGDELDLPFVDSSNSFLEKNKSTRDFDYIFYLDSMLRKQRLLADTVRLNRNTGKVMPAKSEKNSFLSGLFHFQGATVFFWLLALFFVAFIIYKIFIQSGFFSVSARKKNNQLQDETEEELQNFDTYDHLIERAEQKSEFNMAVRYHFLKTLKILRDGAMIQYAPDKTNREYIAEMKDKPFVEGFKELTRNYEFVWYGEFSLTTELYQKMKNSFHAFNDQLIHRP